MVFSKDLKTHTLSLDEIKKRHLINALFSMWDFFVLGIKHIIIGYDHILFLLGLLLVADTLKRTIKIVTAFTIAHSITLILATFGIFALPPAVAESLIALSIFYVAVENVLIINRAKVLQKHTILNFFGNPSHRWILAFLFGLIHGFGFSYVLQEIGLPKEGLILSLLSFNLGVEAGQLAIILLIFPLIWFVKKTKWYIHLVITISVIIGTLGFFWFLDRSF